MGDAHPGCKLDLGHGLLFDKILHRTRTGIRSRLTLAKPGFKVLDHRVSGRLDGRRSPCWYDSTIGDLIQKVTARFRKNGVLQIDEQHVERKREGDHLLVDKTGHEIVIGKMPRWYDHRKDIPIRLLGSGEGKVGTGATASNTSAAAAP